MMNDSISEEEYRKILKKSWGVVRDTKDSFPPCIDQWIVQKSTALGVPAEYLCFPLISAVSYCMGTSFVEVTKNYHEPVITYCLVAGRSGTNKSASLEVIKKLILSIDRGDDADVTKPLFDTGTLEGLLTQLKINDGTILCAVDEFSSFVDNMDKGATGHSERARYLSLHSGSSWEKQTKGGGCVSVLYPRFNFVSFIQNFPLINSMAKQNHYEGFFPRFMIATPREVFTTFGEKIESSENPDQVNMAEVLQKIYNRFHATTQHHHIKLTAKAIEFLGRYHDDTVQRHRRELPFEDLKTMVLSKSISNLIRVSAVMSALRVSSVSVSPSEEEPCSAETMSNEPTPITMSTPMPMTTDVSMGSGAHDDEMQLLPDSSSSSTTEVEEHITEVDMVRAMKIINYSVECFLALSPAEASLTKTVVRKMPNPDIVDTDFVIRHKTKVKKLFQHKQLLNNCIPLSVVTRDHLYPQYGGVTGKDVAITFLKGLQKVGLGGYVDEDGARPYFRVIDTYEIENLEPQVQSLITKLQLHKVHSTA
jgi:hypothetical protein